MDCGVATGVVSFEFIVSSNKFITTNFGYGGEFSSSTLLPIIKLANIRRSNFLL